MIDEWFASKKKLNLPVFGAYNKKNELLGFGTYGPFRNWPAYKYTLEHSVYVKPGERRKQYRKKTSGKNY